MEVRTNMATQPYGGATMGPVVWMVRSVRHIISYFEVGFVSEMGLSY
jgi:hypothetical protein